MRIIGGADGCKGGWIVALKDLASGTIRMRLCASAGDIFQAEPALRVLAIDIPIGLPQSGPRTCDLMARRLLGRRGCCVFPAPIRPVLKAASYAEACALQLNVESKRISRQAFGLIPKIVEMDEWLQAFPGLQTRVRESHPEVCFALMADGMPCRYGKKTPAGREERRRLIARRFERLPPLVPPRRKGLRCAEDDMLDAFAVLWTAERIAWGQAIVLSGDPARDAYGLNMEIVV